MENSYGYHVVIYILQKNFLSYLII